MIERKLVAFDLKCKYWVHASQIGETCVGNGCEGKLVRRRPFVCSVCGHSAKLKRDVHDGRECPGAGGWN